MPDYVGYLASVLVLCTFCARTMIPLRLIALENASRLVSRPPQLLLVLAP